MNKTPPTFYLTNAKNESQVWTFASAASTNENYSSSPHVTPLHGRTSPYVAQGSGGGYSYNLTAIINGWYAFYAQGSVPSSTQRATSTPDREAFEDYLSLKQLIADYGPSPLMVFHRPLQKSIEVALVNFSANIDMRESEIINGNEMYPSFIPVSMNLIERTPWKVKAL